MNNMNNEIYLKYLEMVRKDGLNLINVPSKYQTEELCLEAIEKNPYALQYIKKQTEKMCMIAVKEDGEALMFVKKQTPEICMAAVKQNGIAIIFVKNQTPELCLEAVKQDGDAITFVKNQTEGICLEAVKQNGLSLRYVENQTPEICMEAVKQDGWALKHVEDKSPDICIAAVKQNGLALYYVEKQTLELCLEAVKQNGLVLYYVENQTPELCLEAIKQNEKAFTYINNENLKEKIKNEIIESKLFKETNTYRAFITDEINCDSSYKSLKDNIERPATIVLNTERNLITISFKDSETKCNAKDILNSLGNYEILGSSHCAIISLDGLSDNKISELFTDVIMKVDESVRNHYDLSRDISDKNVKDVDDIEL